MPPHKTYATFEMKDESVSVSQKTVESTDSDRQKSGTIALGGSVDIYKPVPEYEGIHRYDPEAEWTEKEEKVLVRRVCLVAQVTLLQ